MKVYMLTVNILYKGGHFPLGHNYGKMGESTCCEWHESLDLQLARFNNVKITEDLDKEDTVENFLYMADIPKKGYKKYREEFDREGYSEIAEEYINYDWKVVTSKKYKNTKK